MMLRFMPYSRISLPWTCLVSCVLLVNEYFEQPLARLGHVGDDDHGGDLLRDRSLYFISTRNVISTAEMPPCWLTVSSRSRAAFLESFCIFRRNEITLYAFLA